MERSAFLRQQAQGLRQAVSVAWVVQQVGAAGAGWLLVCVAAPSLLPVPGVGNVTGVALMVLALWMLQGRRAVHLPARLAALRLGCAQAQKALRALAQLAEWSERHMQPRLPRMVGPRVWSASSIPVGLMGFVIFLPLPLGNVFGAASVVLLGLGYAMEDGWVVVLAWVASALTVVYAAAVAWGLHAAWGWVSGALG